MKRFLATALLLGCAVSTANAATSTLSFADLGTPTVNTGNINTATVFNIGDLVSTSGAGFFAGLPNQTFGAVSYNTTVGTSLSFSSTLFGTFTSTSITPFNGTTPGSISAFILGNYTAGTYAGGGGEVSGPASFTISWTQTPPSNGGISDSSTLSTPPAPPPPGVPEPASVVLGLTSIAGGVFFHLVRRRRSAKAAA